MFIRVLASLVAAIALASVSFALFDHVAQRVQQAVRR